MLTRHQLKPTSEYCKKCWAVCMLLSGGASVGGRLFLALLFGKFDDKDFLEGCKVEVMDTLDI